VVGLGVLTPLSVPQLADLRSDLANALLTDTVTVLSQTQTINAAGEKTYAATSTAWKGKALRLGGEGMDATALGLSGLDAFTVLLEDTAAPKPADEATALEFPGLTFELLDAHPVRAFEGSILYWRCRAQRKRAT
jgi:hypothetical protein